MKGAREYAELFRTGQYGRLYIVSSSHARGKTFHIFVLPENYKEKDNVWPSHENAVEVYGIIGGQPGWTEEYGWLHRGKWCEDFADLCKSKRAEIEERDELHKKEVAKVEQEEKDHIQKLLSEYT